MCRVRPAVKKERARMPRSSLVVRLHRPVLAMASASLLFLLLIGPAQATTAGANGTIAFITYWANHRHLFVMSEQGTDVTDLDPGYRGEEGSPAWSPNGERIAFSRGDRGRGQIWLVDADGQNLSQLTSETRDADEPSWSPDGSHIVFQSGRRLVTIGVDGGGRTELVRGDSPDWSPDGSRILFSRFD